MDQIPNGDAEVEFMRCPYGTMNLIPVDERGWMYLESFVTMLKAAMIHDESFDDCIFCNSDATKTLLRNGARTLRAAADDSSLALAATLEAFKEELYKKQFSASSTDKLMMSASSLAITNYMLAINRYSRPVDCREQARENLLHTLIEWSEPLPCNLSMRS